MKETSNVSPGDASIENVPDGEDIMPMAGLCFKRMLAPGNGSLLETSFITPVIEIHGCALSSPVTANANRKTNQCFLTAVLSS